jgi:hypothetical protein
MTMRFGFAIASRKAPLALAVFTNTICCSWNGTRSASKSAALRSRPGRLNRVLVVVASVADEQR